VTPGALAGVRVLPEEGEAMTETMMAPESMGAPKRSRPIWLVVLIVLVVVCCCCAALLALTGALWNFGDQLFGLGYLLGTALPA
jgi:low affinity Fe/Cu permease